ncbi:hypothetical protein ACHHYP_08192 [Achlya hypogyna]|uniref:Uncharacterized protein n=1 Tax=Achlya hypogyna TaxID=1202772 RepID=A0A1V9YPU4_ACHHY|nr:hypothetical protein ACHHYP_08192 [Achlya hypogyna]
MYKGTSDRGFTAYAWVVPVLVVATGLLGLVSNCAPRPHLALAACQFYAVYLSLYVMVWVGVEQYEAAKLHLQLQNAYAQYVGLYRQLDAQVFLAGQTPLRTRVEI